MRASRRSGLVESMIGDYAGGMVQFSLVLALALVCQSAVGADVYRWKNAEGNLTFSDTPRDGAEKIEIGDVMTIPAHRATQTLSSVKEKPKAVKYNSVAISSPANDHTYRNNEALTVPVSVSVSPPLQIRFGHNLQLLVNGQSSGEPGRSLNFSLDEVERGEHRLQAVVLGPDGTAIERSPVSKFFVHKPSIANRAP